MGQATPSQQPAVVFRSHYNYLQALLAVATAALVGLTAAVVILATEDEVDSRGRSEDSLSLLSPKEKQRVEALSSLSSAQLAAAFGHATIPAPPPSAPYQGDPRILGPAPSTPYDGDPGIFGPAPSRPHDSDRGIFPAPPRGAGSANQMKDEAGNAATIGEPTGGPEFRGSKASEDGSSAWQPLAGARP
jgi:hypothetical protein